MESLGTGADGRQASEGARKLEQLIGFTYHLVLVNELLAGWRLQEIEAAILAAAAPAAHCGDDVARRIDKNRIARKLLYPAYEIGLSNEFPRLAPALILIRS